MIELRIVNTSDHGTDRETTAGQLSYHDINRTVRVVGIIQGVNVVAVGRLASVRHRDKLLEVELLPLPVEKSGKTMAVRLDALKIDTHHDAPVVVYPKGNA